MFTHTNVQNVVYCYPHSVDAGTILKRSNQSYTHNKTLLDTTYSRLNRSDKKTEEIATYDYADPTQPDKSRVFPSNQPTTNEW